MAKKNAAIVTVTSGWISKNGFGGLFKGAFAASGGNAMIEATDHSLADHFFVEVEFYPSFLNGHWIRLFIPRGEIVSIIVLEKAEDVSRIGLQRAEGNHSVRCRFVGVLACRARRRGTDLFWLDTEHVVTSIGETSPLHSQSGF